MLPPRYSYMNYGPPVYYGPAQPQTYTGVRLVYVPGQTYRPYGPAPVHQKPHVVSDQRIGCNSNYLKSPLGLLRLFLILSLIATVILSALIRKRQTGAVESSWNTSVWISTLVFACVGLATCFLIFFFNVCNCVNVSVIGRLPCTILFALFDLAWFAAMTVLGAFCARREAVITGDYGSIGISRGLFGSTAGLALFSALLFLLSALFGFIKRRAPLRTVRALSPVY